MLPCPRALPCDCKSSDLARSSYCCWNISFQNGSIHPLVTRQKLWGYVSSEMGSKSLFTKWMAWSLPPQSSPKMLLLSIHHGRIRLSQRLCRVQFIFRAEKLLKIRLGRSCFSVQNVFLPYTHMHIHMSSCGAFHYSTEPGQHVDHDLSPFYHHIKH